MTIINWELMLCSVSILLSRLIIMRKWSQSGDHFHCYRAFLGGGRAGRGRGANQRLAGYVILCCVVLCCGREKQGSPAQPGSAQQQFYTEIFSSSCREGEGSGGYLHMTGWQCVDIITHPVNINENSQFTQFSHSSILLTFRQLSCHSVPVVTPIVCFSIKL